MGEGSWRLMLMRTNIVVGLLAVLAVATAHAVAASSATNWYAEVETTGGSFTIALDWEGAPKGCAAFAGLAEGLSGWLDPQSKEVRNGVEYYPGTAVSWVQRDEGDEVLLVGNRGRVFTRADGTTNAANGSGVQFEDDLRTGGGRSLKAGTVAMMNAAGPDTLDGQWAVMLKDADAYYGGRWSGIGTVVSNWAVVEALAAREAPGNVMTEPAEVKRVRLWSDPPEALAAWRAESTNWPVYGALPLNLELKGVEGKIWFEVWGKSRLSFARTADLTGQLTVIEDWNEEEEGYTVTLPFLTEPPDESGDGAARLGRKHFFSETVSETAYPELTLPVLLGDGYGLLTEWEWGDGSVERYLHELDWAAGTGTVWKATDGGEWVFDAPVRGIGFWRSGAHSGELVLVETERQGGAVLSFYYHYLLGVAGEDGKGRFRLQVDTVGGTVEVWGRYGWEKRDGGSAANRDMKSGGGIRMHPGEWRGEAPPPAGRGWFLPVPARDDGGAEK